MRNCSRALVLATALLCAAQPTAARDLRADTVVVVGFSPASADTSAEEIVLQTIALARERIRVAMFTFSSRRIAAALVDAHARGVDVAVVVDPNNSRGPRTALASVRDGGIAARGNGHYANMHHKFMVVDGRHLQTGSYNYTYSAATKNAENVILLRDAPAAAAAFEREWQRLWDEAEPLATAP